MTNEGTVEVVTRLFGAAHWQPGEADYTLWSEALADIGDDEAKAAAIEMIGHIDPNQRRYSPALLRETVNTIRARLRVATPALPEDTSLPADREMNRAALLEAKAKLAQIRGPLAERLRETVRTPNLEDFDEAGELRP